MNKDTLEKSQSIATIFSLVAVPLLVAWGTLRIQNNMTAEGLKKDYVTLAVGLLTKTKDEQPDLELRQWAVDVVDKNSPVPLPPGLKEKLGAGGARLAAAFPVSAEMAARLREIDNATKAVLQQEIDREKGERLSSGK